MLCKCGRAAWESGQTWEGREIVSRHKAWHRAVPFGGFMAAISTMSLCEHCILQEYQSLAKSFGTVFANDTLLSIL